MSHLFIVSRDQPELYSYLLREFSEEPDVRVILDRRLGERRQSRERRTAPRLERRDGDRRRTDRRAGSDLRTQLSTLGYAFVRV